MKVEFVDLARQYRSIKDEVDEALLAAVASTQYILGDEVTRFEQEFAEYCEVAHCVGVGSGTAAIALSLEALGIGPGDEVIAPANTFIATVTPILRLGGRPVLVDCDPSTAQIDPAQVQAAISSRTKAVIAVHLYGQPADAEPLTALCEENGITLIEDACQAHGARYRGRRTGSLGHIAAFSFYPGKNLGAYGDGGAITTDDAELAERIRILRNLGQAEKYVHVALGPNERLDTVHAAVLRVKLRHLDGWNELRRAHAAAYCAALEDAPLQLPGAVADVEHVWHLFVVRSPRRDVLRDALAQQGIACGMHYPLALHLQPALSQLGYRAGDFPVTEAWANELLSLPMFPELQADELAAVVETVKLAAA
ncbi:MAG: DegT/DnrJ/EryC1/StrS family aminotransferase [Solirubrobacteraceae bacterium]